MTPPPSPIGVTLVTPSFARDYERFCLQRESIERCGIDIPHFALINHEDLPRFRDLPFQRALTLVSTRDLLPRRIEQRRLAWGKQRRRHPRFWFSGRGIHGWGIQQLLKLAAPAVTNADVLVCLDSDTFFVRRVTSRDFLAPDGRPHLYETSGDLDAQMAEWHAHALRFLGLPTLGEPPRRYTHSPVPWRRDVLLELHAFVEKSHRKGWMEAIIDADRIMEYTLYGTFARHVDQLRRSVPASPDLTLYYWWPADGLNPQLDIPQRLSACGAKMVLINSNLQRPVGSYRAVVEAAWAAADPRPVPA